MSSRLTHLLPVLLLSAVAAAETAGKTQSGWKLASVEAKGLRHFSQDQFLAASGLKLGQTAGERDFKSAAEKLGATGLFRELAYSYRYSPAGLDLEFEVTENEELVPLRFENFAWFSDHELLGLLRSRIPLFPDRVPTAGDLTSQVADTLASILNQRNIQAEVEYLPFARAGGGIEAYDYRVHLHPIVVRSVSFPGIARDELSALNDAAKPLLGEDYLRTHLRAQEEHDFLPVYRARGYLRAQFADPEAKVVEDGARTLVDVSFPVTPGAQYRFNDLEIVGNTAFLAPELREQIHLRKGEPVDAVQLTDDFDRIHKLYGTKGYLFARVDPIATMDDRKATVSYLLKVSEGDLYRMGDLSMDGIPRENADRIVAEWQMKKGDPFDESYFDKFFTILYRDFRLRQSYDITSNRVVDRQARTVSLSLHFVPKS